jgi:transcriptional regulator GlxA family with amidase domain
MSSRRSVCCLLMDGTALIDIAGPLEALGSANYLETMAGRPAPYRIELLSLDGESVKTSIGMRVMPTTSQRELDFDTLLVPGLPPDRAPPAAVVDWLSRYGPRFRRIVAICTGARLLAAAGLVQGRVVATHWRITDLLAQKHPGVRVDSEAIYVVDDNVWTSAGMTSGIDLALALIQEDFGHDIALRVAREMVVYVKRPGNQAQFSAPLLAQSATRDLFDELHRWVREHPDAKLDLSQLARVAKVSPRTLTRSYTKATGRTPARMVLEIRLEVACQALTATAQPLKRIAANCGFGGERTLRRQFQSRFGITPSDYRERFGSGTQPARQ